MFENVSAESLICWHIFFRYSRLAISLCPGFTGLSLLIFWHFGYDYKCYTLQEFMGRNLLALNVMWKYLEQVSGWLTRIFRFPSSIQLRF